MAYLPVFHFISVLPKSHLQHVMALCDVQRPVYDKIMFPQKLPSLRSNQGKHVDEASTGWMQSVAANTPFEEMRALYERDGYLWVKNLIPREDVLEMREQ